MDPLRRSLANLWAQFSQLGLGQKVLVGTLLLGLVFSAGFLFNQAQDDYDVLYANLSLPDAAAMVGRLKEAKAPFRLAENGTTILVPRQRKNELILETAGELSSDQTVSLSQIPPIVQGDVQKEWIKKFNTDAIADVLRSMRGIKNAQVLISQPEHNLFSDTEEVPSASVMLIVEPGFRLKGDHIKGIKNLVSHAVPGLKPENVVLADNQGNTLEDMSSGAGLAGLTEAEIRRKHLEEETTRKVFGVLGPVVGKENAVVAVSVSLNFDQAQSRIHRVIPSGGSSENPTGLTVSQQEQVEDYGGTGPGPGGAGGNVGVESNTGPTYQASINPIEKTPKQNTYRNTRKTINYTNSEEDKSVIYAPGSVERMTVAVVLNKVLTTREIEEIRDIVANAAGIDQARGDSVEVKGFQFSSPPANRDKALADASKAAADQAFILQIASTVGVILLSLASLFLFFSLLKQRPSEGELLDGEAMAELPPGMSAAALMQGGVQGEGVVAGMPAVAGGVAPGMPGAPQALPGQGDLPQTITVTPPPSQPTVVYKQPEIPVLEIEIDPDLESKRNAINAIISADPAEAARFLVSYMRD